MGKCSAQARNEVEAGGVRDQNRMAATRYEARGNAREPDGGNAGMPSEGQQYSLRSKYCCFVEYRCKQTRPESIWRSLPTPPPSLADARGQPGTLCNVPPA